MVLMTVDERDAGAERLETLAEALRTEILALDVDDVTSVQAGEPPAGARGFDMAAAGALLASVNGSALIIRQLVTAVRSWLGRNRDSTPRTVELTIGDKTLRLTDASAEQQDRLIEEFVRSVARQ
jgi:Effector Associated Constant Component 1